MTGDRSSELRAAELAVAALLALSDEDVEAAATEADHADARAVGQAVSRRLARTARQDRYVTGRLHRSSYRLRLAMGMAAPAPGLGTHKAVTEKDD